MYNVHNCISKTNVINNNIICLKPGKSLFFEGDDADFIFEIVEGVSRSSRVSPEGRRKVLAFGYEGHILGNTGALSYSHDCDAMTEMKVRVYSKVKFDYLIKNDASFCRHFVEKAMTEVDQMHERCMMLSHKSASAKLASFLCELMQHAGVRKGRFIQLSLPVKRADIADFLGLTVETVSRNLTRFKEQKIIDISRAKIIQVLQPKALQKIAQLT